MRVTDAVSFFFLLAADLAGTTLLLCVVLMILIIPIGLAAKSTTRATSAVITALSFLLLPLTIVFGSLYLEVVSRPDFGAFFGMLLFLDIDLVIAGIGVFLGYMSWKILRIHPASTPPAATTASGAIGTSDARSGGYSGLFAAGAHVLAFAIPLVMLVTKLGRKIG
jgi:hypothetical protein